MIVQNNRTLACLWYCLIAFVVSLCVGALFHILRNGEDLKILCNMGKTWQFANSAKTSQTLILDVRNTDSLSDESDIGGLDRCETWRTGRKERKKRNRGIIRTKGSCWGFGFRGIWVFCLRIFWNKSEIYCYYNYLPPLFRGRICAIDFWYTLWFYTFLPRTILSCTGP